MRLRRWLTLGIVAILLLAALSIETAVWYRQDLVQQGMIKRRNQRIQQLEDRLARLSETLRQKNDVIAYLKDLERRYEDDGR